MQLKLDGLDAHLKQAKAKGLAPLYVVHGDEHLLVLEAVDRLRAAAREAGFSEREVLVAERSFHWGRLVEAQQSMSLFGDRKIVELRIPSGKPGKDGGEALRAVAAQPSPDVVMLVTLPRLDFAASKSAWFQALEGAGVSIKVDSVDRTRLPAWVGERLALQQQRVQGGEPGRRALQFIADKVEGNLLAAHQEIQKLGLLYPPGELSFDQVHDAVLNVARYDVFKLSESMLSGDVPRLVRMLEGLRGEGEATVLVLWALTEEIRVLSKVRQGLAAGKPAGVLMRELRVWGPRERLVPQAAQRLPQPRLEAALALAARLDRQVKGLQDLPPPGAAPLPAEPWDGLQQLALMIAR
ncbi:DNA polymerase III, delta subunit [Cupriavidus taiwanensis]|uniref:DNA polymerase III subunit delta n=1 Tax=Cupriavidus taiwanensis TaxID=164546 RepID=A0A375E210_9BURK|nr:DNA polymerase III subunit delta [Cupriavidus taiwanensis]SOZ14153.1 DNA polymerase III, delta subunit [Cupriavidus taiwanensis]SOZ25518.1 DNA polymerase III, delta subunit [Cupriavidus taiwanensis]SOZ44769.1 DNA polymerase III, delta subunit [Cupriavidus taiwanensis]SOZ55739.1 DNA polymerase III, delta subunit [Cupriavidus taiwanensis]SOZ57190.1 DNA polymerase III, delta subunit [Cupriavidus taiwanensis]